MSRSIHDFCIVCGVHKTYAPNMLATIQCIICKNVIAKVCQTCMMYKNNIDTTCDRCQLIKKSIDNDAIHHDKLDLQFKNIIDILDKIQKDIAEIKLELDLRPG